MRVGVLFSGGKDSTYTLWLAQQQFEVVTLVTVLSTHDSYLYHYQHKHIAKILAEAIDLPLLLIKLASEQDELDTLEAHLRSLEIQALCIGGLLSEYQRTRFNEVASRLHIPCFAPLWRKDSILLLKDITSHFQVIITTIASMGFKKEDLGRELDLKMIQRLKDLHARYGVSLTGEGGEYESLVLDAPFYKKKIVLDEVITHWDATKFFGYLEIIKLHLEEK